MYVNDDLRAAILDDDGTKWENLSRSHEREKVTELIDKADWDGLEKMTGVPADMWEVDGQDTLSDHLERYNPTASHLWSLGSGRQIDEQRGHCPILARCAKHAPSVAILEDESGECYAQLIGYGRDFSDQLAYVHVAFGEFIPRELLQDFTKPEFDRWDPDGKAELLDGVKSTCEMYVNTAQRLNPPNEPDTDPAPDGTKPYLCKIALEYGDYSFSPLFIIRAKDNEQAWKRANKYTEKYIAGDTDTENFDDQNYETTDDTGKWIGWSLDVVYEISESIAAELIKGNITYALDDDEYTD